MDKKGKDRGDLLQLLSQDHLQHLYARFLGVRISKKNKSPVAANSKEIVSLHPLWDRIEKLIHDKSDDTMPKLPLSGLSLTINEHLRQLSTAISNMWDGAIYRKSLDYLLRILLRLHLAPERESRYQARAKTFKPKIGNKNRAAITRTLWRSKLNRLCNQLCKAIQARPDRTDIIIQRLCDLNKLKPTSNPLPRRTLPLEQQLQALEGMSQMMASNNVTINCNVGVDDVDDDDDGDDDDTSDYDDDGGSGETLGVEESTESSRRRLRSLQAVLKILLESPCIDEKIDCNWVRKTAHSNSNFTARECQVVVKLANLFRPYIPRRGQDSNDTSSESIAHVALRAPLVLIANAILKATGYHQFTREICPQIPPSSVQGLILGARGIFEVFCGRSDNQYSIVGNNGSPLTNGNDVSKNKEAIFGSFFNAERIQELCQSHGLKFIYRQVS
jgi:hypothetical protein